KPLLHPPPQERIALLLQRFEEGDLNAWWALTRELPLEPDSTHYGGALELESDIAVLAGWKAADATTRSRIVEAAKQYLIKAQPRVAEWLGTDIFHRDFAAYKAIRLLAQRDQAFLDSLAADTWKKLAPIIIGFPTVTGAPNDTIHQGYV